MFYFIFITDETILDDGVQNQTHSDLKINDLDSLIKYIDNELPSTSKNYVTIEENNNSNVNHFENNENIELSDVDWFNEMINLCDNLSLDDEIINKPKKNFNQIVSKSLVMNDSEVEHLKKTLDAFEQKCVCLYLPSNIPKCIECHTFLKMNLTLCDYDKNLCRLYAFRQLKFTNKGNITVANYLDPYKDADDTDLSIWLPSELISTPSNFNIKASMKILEDIGSLFCKFVQDENKASKLNWKTNKKRRILWKKYVCDMRELCDVCKTTIFNYHWCCRKCGFVVCVDCFRAKLGDKEFSKMSSMKNKVWLPCSDLKEHQVDKLSITKIIAGNALSQISNIMHEVCQEYNILLDCNCYQKWIPNKYLDTVDKASLIIDESNEWFSNTRDEIDDDDDYQITPLRLIMNKVHQQFHQSNNETKKNTSEIGAKIVVPVENIKNTNDSKNKNEKDKSPNACIKRAELCLPNILRLYESQTNHSYRWLCDGSLLCLLDPECNANYALFQVCTLKTKY